MLVTEIRSWCRDCAVSDVSRETSFWSPKRHIPVQATYPRLETDHLADRPGETGLVSQAPRRPKKISRPNGRLVEVVIFVRQHLQSAGRYSSSARGHFRLQHRTSILGSRADPYRKGCLGHALPCTPGSNIRLRHPRSRNGGYP